MYEVVPQLPPLQLDRLHVRDCVPVSSHVVVKPPHAPYAGHCTPAPQVRPSGFRVQPARSVSVIVLELHVPAPHVNDVQSRVREPVFEHVGSA